jgi:hypothetical protein
MPDTNLSNGIQKCPGCLGNRREADYGALPDSINLCMPAECVNKSPHGICARECVSPMQVRLLRAQRMWGSAKLLCGGQQNPQDKNRESLIDLRFFAEI